MSDKAVKTVKTVKTIENISSEAIEELFETYFSEKVASFADIESFDVTCTKDLQSKKAIVSVQVYGTAGAPTVDDFKNNRVKFKGVQSVVVERADLGRFEFDLKPEKTVVVNSNDYMIVYESK